MTIRSTLTDRGASSIDGRTLLTDTSTHYCPGCGHGIIHRLVAELLDEMHLGRRRSAVASVGCSVFAYDYLAVDFVEAPHGRAPAVATGVRRVRPDAFVFTYQGDGDLAAIGTAEIVHAAARGERISVIFVNNGIYGMTGGQMAPDHAARPADDSSPTRARGVDGRLPDPDHRDARAAARACSYAARGSIADPQWIGRTKAMLRRAFEVQLAGGGLSIVEILSTCPVGWGMTPTESMEHLARDVVADLSARRPRRPGEGRHRHREGLTMQHATIFGGFGGQGLLFAGHVLAQAAVIEGRTVSWMPSYGPEMRGGTASCTVIIADHPIGSPIVDSADSVVALNPPSLAKLEPLLVAGSLLVVDSALVSVGPRPGVEIVDIPCTQLAMRRRQRQTREHRGPGCGARTTRSGLGSGGARGARRDRRREASGAPRGQPDRPRVGHGNCSTGAGGGRTLRLSPGTGPLSTVYEVRWSRGGPSDGRRRSDRARPRW